MQDEIVKAAGDKWEFDSNVADVFGDMLSRSIPDYDTMRSLTFKVARNYISPYTSIVDIGCSNGYAVEPFVEEFGGENEFYLYDVSDPMLEKARERYIDLLKYIHIENYDLRQGLSENLNSSLILSILTVQFTPIEYRQRIVNSIYKALNPGGAFILVEKVLGTTVDIDNVLVKEYYGIKRENQYTQEQIESKRKSLEGVLVPITAKWNEDLLKNSGFEKVDCFWRYLNFCGWVAVKS